MLKKVIKYTDFNGVEREEEFYFNLTEAELAEMNLKTKGGLKAHLEAIIEAKDTPELTKLFETIVKKSYGVKSPDGRKFLKTKEILEDFTATQAYSDLYMELITNADAASNFINSIVPASIVANAKAIEAK